MDDILKKHMEDQAENEVKFAKYDKEIKSIKHRVDNAEKIIENIHELSFNVRSMCEELKRQSDEIEKQSDRIEKLEIAPARKWNKLSDTIIACAASGIVGYILANVL